FLSSLVNLANDWLHENKHWKIVNCETVTQYSKQKSEEVDYSAIVRTLRIWIQRSNVGYVRNKKNEMIFWHKDFKPKQRNCFLLLDDVIKQLNLAIRAGEVRGKIINVETVRCQATDNWLFNPQLTFVNKGNTNKEIHEFRNFVFIIRVYYETCPLDSLEEVGLKDFVPLNLSPENRKTEFTEDFSSVFNRASQWISKNPEVNFCNAQAVDTIVQEGESGPNTKVMTRTKYEKEAEIRFLRIYYTKPMKEFCDNFPLSLVDKTAIYLASTSIAAKKCQEQIDAWFANLSFDSENYKYRVLAAETLVLPPYVKDKKGVNFLKAVDEIFRCNRLEGRLRYAFLAIRLYYDEGYDSLRQNNEIDTQEFIDFN
ncbi:uncharacterized protein B4U79_11171, partial [Dinothrombium tinctorium]